MITAKTGTGSSWEQFLKLKAQAQVRNTGLTTKTAATQPTARTTDVGAASQALSARSVNTAATMANYTYTSRPAETMQTKILGGMFDAWA